MAVLDLFLAPTGAQETLCVSEHSESDQRGPREHSESYPIAICIIVTAPVLWFGDFGIGDRACH